MNEDVQTYNESQTGVWKEICDLLAKEIIRGLPDSRHKVWHGSPVWFIDGNPIVGYAVRKTHVQLLFWSGQSFDEPELEAEGSFKAAEKRYTVTDQIEPEAIRQWLRKAGSIQWDYKNIVKRRGVLERLK